MVTATCVAVLGDVAQHAEVVQGEHRHLGVGHRRGDASARRRCSPQPLGWARATTCISASSRPSASVCTRAGRAASCRTAAVGALDAAGGEDLRRARRRPRPRRAGSTPNACSAASARSSEQRNSSSYSGQTASSPASSRRRDSSVPLGQGEEPAAGVVAVVGQLLDALAPRSRRAPGRAWSTSRSNGASRQVENSSSRAMVAAKSPLSTSTAARCGSRPRRGRTPARPRPAPASPPAAPARRTGRRPPRGPAAAGPGRAGRARCWPARCPPRGRARCCTTRERRWAKISASSPSIRQYAARSARVDARRGRCVSTPASGSSKSVPNAHWRRRRRRAGRRRRSRASSGRGRGRSSASHVGDVVGDGVEGRVPVDLVAGGREERVLLVGAGRGDVGRPAPPRC